MAGVAGRSGRKPKAEKYIRPINAAEKKIADKLPWLIDQAMELAAGVSVEQTDGDSTKVYLRPPDRQAIEYLVNRIMGKPVERQEQLGPDGGPVIIRHRIEDLRNMAPEDLVRLHSETLGDPEEDR